MLAWLAGEGAPALAAFLGRQRWYAGGGRPPRRARVADWAVLPPRPGAPPGPLILLLLVAADRAQYYVPLAVGPEPAAPATPAEVARIAGLRLTDAHAEPEFGRRLVDAVARKQALPAQRGAFAGHWTGEVSAPGAPPVGPIPVSPLGGEQSNTSLLVGGLVAKSIRRLAPGANPEREMTHFLATRTSFAQAPALAGWLDYVPRDGEPVTVCLLHAVVENQGDGWRWVLGELRRLGDALGAEVPPAGPEEAEGRLRGLGGDLLDDLRLLGSITGGLHGALAGDAAAPAFAPEPVQAHEARGWSRRVGQQTRRALEEARRRLPDLPEPARTRVQALLARARVPRGRALDLSALVGATWKIRIHGDYHLGQVLRTTGGFTVIDFEGEPLVPPAERRDRQPALRDVAGMLRSLSYAAGVALDERPAAEGAVLVPWFERWERLAREAFRRGYLETAARSPVPLAPPSEEAARRACTVFELGKAAYELTYELAHRPHWAGIAAGGISRILEGMGARA